MTNHPNSSTTVGQETCMDLFRVQANIPSTMLSPNCQ
ncbi:hypothetical protein GLGCALEP_06289 [Pseudomonas sp. MM221]|nr:hypothetical protein DBADOPDK_06138 [Pseudomonas sp. MM223]CAI3810986.1 hypothetical protein GLGCALEP_06289 [Pseudomonas sp. MM221]